jgi:WD40 repeat protein
VGARAIIGDPARDPLRAKGTYDVRALASSRTSADRTLVLATVGDGAIWAWDCTASSVGTPLNRYASSVHALQTLAGPGGRPWLATGGKAGPVRVWDILTGSPTGRPMVGHSGPVSTLAIFTGPDGHSLLASGGADSTVRVWDLVSRTQIGPPLAGVGSVHALTVVPGPGGRPWLAAAGARGLVRVWDALTGVEMGDPVAHPGGVSALTAVSDASGHTFLVSGGHGGTVRLWDPAAPAMRMDIRLDIAVFAVTAMGSDLAVGTAEGLVVVSPGWVVLEQHRRFSGAPSRVFGAGLAHAPSFRGTGGRLQDLVRGAVVRR